MSTHSSNKRDRADPVDKKDAALLAGQDELNCSDEDMPLSSASSVILSSNKRKRTSVFGISSRYGRTIRSLNSVAEKKESSSESGDKGDTQDEDEPNEIYNVEEIIGKRKNPNSRQVEYLVKWEGYPSTQNTWEPVHHIQCRQMIKAFESSQAMKELKKKKPRTTSLDLFEMAVMADDQDYGFDKGFSVRCVMGAIRNNDQTYFLVLFSDNCVYMVPNKICKEKCPQELIKFYQTHLVWE